MLIETYSVKARPNVDRENDRLNNVVVMTTEFNLNRNATFTAINQAEIVSLGNSEKTYCYLGHAKEGFTSSDRLPFRLGYFENFRVEDTKVKADLVLSPTIDSNPVLLARFPTGIKEYIFALAENEADECGFSMVVGMMYNDDDSVTVGALYSIDVVESPALCLSLFAKAEKTFEDPAPILVESFSYFNKLDDAIKQGSPIDAVLASLLESLSLLNVVSVEDAPETVLEPVLEPENTEAPTEPEKVEEVPEPTPEPEIEPIVEPTVEPTVEPIAESSVESNPVDEIRSEFAEIKETIKQLQELIASRFSVQEKEPEEKKLVLSFNSPMPIESSQMSKEDHKEEYSRLMKEDKVLAAKYFKKHLM